MFPLISAIVLRRLLLAIPTLLLLSLVVFVVLRMLPVDPLVLLLPASATAADAAVLREQLGFDKPVPQQFLIWLWQAFNGNLGTSINFRQPVAPLMLSSLPATLELTLAGLLLALAISLPARALAYPGNRLHLPPAGRPPDAVLAAGDAGADAGRPAACACDQRAGGRAGLRALP